MTAGANGGEDASSAKDDNAKNTESGKNANESVSYQGKEYSPEEINQLKKKRALMFMNRRVRAQLQLQNRGLAENDVLCIRLLRETLLTVWRTAFCGGLCMTFVRSIHKERKPTSRTIAYRFVHYYGSLVDSCGVRLACALPGCLFFCLPGRVINFLQCPCRYDQHRSLAKGDAFSMLCSKKTSKSFLYFGLYAPWQGFYYRCRLRLYRGGRRPHTIQKR